MKTKLYLLFFFVFPLFMSACRGDDPIPDPPVDGKRTVLVYMAADTVSYTHLRAHETRHDLVCRLLLEKKKIRVHSVSYTHIEHKMT